MAPWETQALSHADTWRPQLAPSDVPSARGRGIPEQPGILLLENTAANHPSSLSGHHLINGSTEGCRARPAVSFFHALCPCSISARHRCCKSFRCCSQSTAHSPVNLSPPLQELLVPGSALQQAIPPGQRGMAITHYDTAIPIYQWGNVFFFPPELHREENKEKQQQQHNHKCFT